MVALGRLKDALTDLKKVHKLLQKQEHTICYVDVEVILCLLEGIFHMLIISI
jgi:hypothetical protein